jgi:hypothetical protein
MIQKFHFVLMYQRILKYRLFPLYLNQFLQIS